MVQAAEKIAQLILCKLQGVAAVSKPQSLEKTLEAIHGAVIPVGYGSISIIGGSTVQTIEGAAEKIINFQVNSPAAGGVTPDFANNRIVIGQAADYIISNHFSFLVGLGAALLTAFLRVNGVESTLGWERGVGAAARVGSASFIGVLTLAAGDVLEMYLEQDAGADREITVVAAQLTVHRLNS
jgi:hypothetical protein